MKTISITKYPQNPKTLRIRKPYKIGLVGLAFLGAAIFSIKLVNVEVSFPVSAKAETASLQSDKIRVLHDGDAVHQIQSVKAAITHNSPDEQPVVEVIDTSYGKPFYFPAVVKNGFAYFQLKAGNPQDASRLFKVRGLLVPKNTNVQFETPEEKPLQGDELFPQLLLNRE